jgi:hypothetical protein
MVAISATHLDYVILTAHKFRESKNHWDLGSVTHDETFGTKRPRLPFQDFEAQPRAVGKAKGPMDVGRGLWT